MSPSAVGALITTAGSLIISALRPPRSTKCFLALPVEIRQHIYAFLFIDSSVSYLIHESWSGYILSDRLVTMHAAPSTGSILFVTHQINREAIPVYWQNVLLRLSGAYWQRQHVDRFLSPTCQAHVTKLSLETLSHTYTSIVSCFPQLQDLRLPEQEILWWVGAGATHSWQVTEMDLEREIREGLRFRAIWETVKTHERLSVKCIVHVIIKPNRRDYFEVCAHYCSGILTKSRQRTWDVDFSKKRILGNMIG